MLRRCLFVPALCVALSGCSQKASSARLRRGRRPPTALRASEDLKAQAAAAEDLKAQAAGLLAEGGRRASLAGSLWSLPRTEASVDVLTAELAAAADGSFDSWSKTTARYWMLADLLRNDADSYTRVATKLVERSSLTLIDLPNAQRLRGVVPLALGQGLDVVADCVLPDVAFDENVFEKALLTFTRDRYAFHAPTGAFRSPRDGISGLLDEMRVLMLDDRGTDDEQRTVVVKVLKDIMTPALPPFYRIFMAGLVPSAERGDPEWLVGAFGRLRGFAARFDEGFANERLAPGARFAGTHLPWAPLLTSLVSPYAFGFLVGPARVNLRDDGAVGGLVVEKCKFLQESGCKGLCLNQCKLPAEALFGELGLALHVSPNFDTQECQWSYGVPGPVPELDPAWPRGCLVGCESRSLKSVQY
ncbi:hypothetical protein M885DRAFT_611499 [Pelagophyceae sp. CCMP2097]|nr:hypothetical protein M885DRAFT_611499 [Pelagophyceae sp. CCMP2097]